MKKLLLLIFFSATFLASSKAYVNHEKVQASYNDDFQDKWVKNMNVSVMDYLLYASGSKRFKKFTHSAVTIFTTSYSKVISNWVYDSEITKSGTYSVKSGILITKVKLQSSGEVMWYKGNKYPFNSWAEIWW